MRGVLRGLFIFLLAFIIYVIYTGSISSYDIITGVMVAAISGTLFSNIVIRNPLKILDLRRWLYLIAYAVIYFTYYETRAHLDVIKRILHPKIPVNPAIVEAPFDLETDYAITTVANSITNTPGTVVVEIDVSKKIYYIHWIDAKTLDPDGVKKEVFESFEKFARKIFE